MYLPDGEDLVVVASNWGQRQQPNWSLNLLAQPKAAVEVNGCRRTVVASAATAEERARLWPKLLEEFPPYQTYANRSGRELRVFLLHLDSGVSDAMP